MTPEIIYDPRPCGKCPVQANGTINGLPFFFRSRGGHWRLSIARTPRGDPLDYQNCMTHFEEYAAGWADEDECVEFIERTARLLLANAEVGNAPPSVQKPL